MLLQTDKTVQLLDTRNNPPREAPQKYGESLVQCAGYYFSKVLDLEEYLLINHYLKYNLRFYWPTEGLDQSEFENYSQLFVRSLSNIPTFQLDRNLLEEFLLESNRANPRCRFTGGVRWSSRPTEARIGCAFKAKRSAAPGLWMGPDADKC